ncbi:MAG: tellurite resistance TerB family protein [Candidatus Competibacteraceae bacterium]|nr:tellurite resistance TerB family protein [Candidatus Competibacteraceae bacterium]
MGFFDDVKARYQEVSANIAKEVGKFKNRKFMEAAVASSVLITYADGQARPEEKQGMLQFFRTSDAMKHFDAQEVKTLYETYCAKVADDFDFGKMDLMQVVGKLRGQEAESRALVRLCIIIGNKDGDFDQREKEVAREIARDLKLDPTEFGL